MRTLPQSSNLVDSFNKQFAVVKKAVLWSLFAIGMSSCSADVNLKLLEDLLLAQNPNIQQADNRSFHFNTAVKSSGNYQFFFVSGDPVAKKEASGGEYTFEPTSIW